MSEWFESWFGQDYIALYPHRDDAEAALAVGTVARAVSNHPIRRVLDLACGAGRHARHLAKHWPTFGLDLSEVLLRVARKESAPALFVRGDMRELPFRDASFDLITNFFTSFGYFDDDSQHRLVLTEVSRVTASAGIFVLDYLNSDNLRRTLIPYDERRIGDTLVEQHREISPDGKFVVKTIAVRGEGRRFVERVRLYSPEELIGLAADAGFQTETVFGDYTGAPLSPQSPRAMIIARRT